MENTSSAEIIRSVFTEEDVRSIAEDADVPVEVALERAWEWGRHIQDTITAIANEQLESVIRNNTP